MNLTQRQHQHQHQHQHRQTCCRRPMRRLEGCRELQWQLHLCRRAQLLTRLQQSQLARRPRILPACSSAQQVRQRCHCQRQSMSVRLYPCRHRHRSSHRLCGWRSLSIRQSMSHARSECHCPGAPALPADIGRAYGACRWLLNSAVSPHYRRLLNQQWRVQLMKGLGTCSQGLCSSHGRLQ